MRRPESNASLTAKDVASSNSTLNTLMGGKRKAWMTDDGVTPPSPRRAISGAERAQHVEARPVPSPSVDPEQPAPYVSPTVGQDGTGQVQAIESPSSMTPRILEPPVPTTAATATATLAPTHVPETPIAEHTGFAVRPKILEVPSHSPHLVRTPVPVQSNVEAAGVAWAEAGGVSPTMTQGPNAVTLEPPGKRQKTVAAHRVPSLKGSIPLLDSFILRNGGLANLTADLEKPRFDLLRGACLKEDCFFVAMHQLYCIHTVNYPSLADIPGLLSGPDTLLGFQIVGQLLRSNDDLSGSVLAFFNVFPGPLKDLVSRSDYYRQNVGSVGRFLGELANRWSTMTLRFQQRNWPPLVDEMIREIGLKSAVMQGIFFTAVRRDLGYSDDKGGKDMDEVFMRDRQGYAALASRYNSAYPPTYQQINERNANIANQYELVSRAWGQLARAARIPLTRPSLGALVVPNLPSPATSGNTNGMPVTSYPQPPMLQGPRTNSLPSVSDQIRNSHDLQAARRTSTNSNLSSHGPTSATTTFSHAQYSPSTNVMNHSSSFDHGGHGRNVPQSWYEVRSVALDARNPRRDACSPPNPVAGMGSPIIMPDARSQSRLSIFIPTQPPQMPGPPCVATTSATGNPLQSNVIPPLGSPLQPQGIDPDVTALHQVKLRSPLLVSKDVNMRLDQTDPACRLYQSISDFLVRPQRLTLGSPISTYTFTLPEALFDRTAHQLAHDRDGTRLTTPQRGIRVNSVYCRIRCTQVDAGTDPISTSAWVVGDCKWPSSIFLDFNGRHLDLRRKVHWGKDLPVDITGFLRDPRSEEKNVARICSYQTKKESREMQYGYAIEIIEISQHEQVLGRIMKQHIPAQQTIDSIKASLSSESVSANDDDELTVLGSDLTISLTDPFTLRIFETPVRSLDCLHRECFDLSTYLWTRPSKPKQPDQPSLVDQWKCPLCGQDARPERLAVDDFMVQVREKLVLDGQLDATSISIDAHGDWKVRGDGRDNEERVRAPLGDDSDDDDDDDEDDDADDDQHASGDRAGPAPPVQTPRTAWYGRRQSSHVEVIELD